MPTLVSGTYKNGAVVLDQTVDWPEDTNVSISVAEDGNAWPKTSEEIEVWSREIEEMPPLFDDSDELAQFEKRLADSKEEQKRLTAQSWETTEKLFG